MADIDNAKGTRDFSPEEKIARDRVLSTLKEVCENYGFNPIETPIIEKYETLAAKFAAGEDSDALTEIFRLSDQGKRKLGLRFDLTVPFSRYIAMNKSTIRMPFKKYLTGEVFRDGPIKTGRYRQFTQFDPDIVGCKGMIADAEILSLVDSAFRRLGLDFYIELNNRKIIEGALTACGVDEKDWFTVTVSIDKLKKIGKKGVMDELEGKGFRKGMDKALDLLSREKDNATTLAKLKRDLIDGIGLEGINEMEELFSYLDSMGIRSIVFDPSLARGLAYYTGPIYEVFLKGSSITSSAAGGGRYDKLISSYIGSDEEVPATGVSFGVEVIIEAMREKGQFDRRTVTKAYIIPIKTQRESIKVARELRDAGINSDIDLLSRGVSKNLDYASSYGIPYVIFVGEKELADGRLKLRDMKTGSEEMLSVKDIIRKLK